MPEISRFFGIIIAMFYNDHPPPHFHVRYGWPAGDYRHRCHRRLEGSLSPRVLRLVVEWAAQHPDELRANWDRARRNETLLPIRPLE